MRNPAPRLLQLGLVLLLCSGGLQSAVRAQSPAAPSQSETEPNKALVRRWIEEGFNQHNLQVVDAIFAETLTINGHLMGRENLKQNMSRWLAAFPDLHVTIDTMIGEGNSVGLWYTVKGIHKGAFEGIPPTGRQVSWVGVDLLRIESGRIAQGTFVDDSLGLLRQLGATPGD